jgi:hypothetical protein
VIFATHCKVHAAEEDQSCWPSLEWPSLEWLSLERPSLEWVAAECARCRCCHPPSAAAAVAFGCTT